MRSRNFLGLIGLLAAFSLQAAPDPERPSILRAGNRYAGPTGDAYLDTVQPAIGARCAVCHSCTNGPCQLNMTSYEALERGLSPFNPYDVRPTEGFSTRVSDKLPLAAWRNLGFTSVLPGQGVAPEHSLFFRSLELGRKNLPSEEGDDDTAGLSTARIRAMAAAHEEASGLVCPTQPDDYSRVEERYPLGGMPWGLPAVDSFTHMLLSDWVRAGARGPSAAARQALSQPEISSHTKGNPKQLLARWEGFLNGPTPESQLVARYIYEHAFQADLHFAENPGEYYRIVRSRTAPGQAIDQIVTPMPVDDPGNGRVFYRLQKISSLIEGKTLVVWPLSLSDLDRLQELFFGTAWKVEKLPAYKTDNPFENFAAIPTLSRARFMIENSKMIGQSFARGPVCLVQKASYSVEEHAWIWFLDPAADPSVQDPELGLQSYQSFFDKDGKTAPQATVRSEAYGEPVYRAAFEAGLRRLRPEGLSINDIWDGSAGKNPNAWLQLHRHQVSTEVTNGADRALSGLPRSIWLLSYANFERMYYNGAASYRYFGSLDHRLDTFNWQIMTRTEAEDLYTSLFAKPELRQSLRLKHSSPKAMGYYGMMTDYAAGRPAPQDFASEDELAQAVLGRIGKALQFDDRLNNWPLLPRSASLPEKVASLKDFEAGLRTLTAQEAPFARFFPNVVHLRLDGQHLYTLLADRGYTPDKIFFTEKESRAPERDRVVAVAGFSAFEAHLFIDISSEQAVPFLHELSAVRSAKDFEQVRLRYGIPRKSPRFWPFVDWLHRWMEEHMPVDAGLMEVKYYDKDQVPF